MNKSILSFAGWLLLSTAIAFYIYGIGKAIAMSWTPLTEDQAKNFPVFLSSAVGSIQAILITNMGVLLGIAIKDPNSAVANQLTIFSGKPTSTINEVTPPLESQEKIQLFGVILLIISFVACMVVWAKRDFVDDRTILPVIIESGKMFIGITLAYFSLLFTKNQKTSI